MGVHLSIYMLDVYSLHIYSACFLKNEQRCRVWENIRKYNNVNFAKKNPDLHLEGGVMLRVGHIRRK